MLSFAFRWISRVFHSLSRLILFAISIPVVSLQDLFERPMCMYLDDLQWEALRFCWPLGGRFEADVSIRILYTRGSRCWWFRLSRWIFNIDSLQNLICRFYGRVVLGSNIAKQMFVRWPTSLPTDSAPLGARVGPGFCASQISFEVLKSNPKS